MMHKRRSQDSKVDGKAKPFLHSRLTRSTLTLACGIIGGLLAAQTALAHQPNFEEADATFAAPISIPEPTISKAYYSTLASAEDVDYFRFSGSAGEEVLIGMTIPVIDGQEFFAPAIALMGSGLDAAELPPFLERPPDIGARILAPLEGEVPVFFEPFSRTRYWRRQRTIITLPATSEYTIAVWSPRQNAGRYVLVTGDREVRGGDPLFASKLGTYWTPVQPAVAPAPTAEPAASPNTPAAESAVDATTPSSAAEQVEAKPTVGLDVGQRPPPNKAAGRQTRPY